MSTTIDETFVPRMLMEIREQITRMDQRLTRQIGDLTGKIAGSEASMRVEMFNQLARFEEHFDARLNSADQVWAGLATRINRVDDRVAAIEAQLAEVLTILRSR